LLLCRTYGPAISPPAAADARYRQAAMIALDAWKRRQQELVEKQRLLNPGDPAHRNDCTYFGATVTCATL